MNPLSDESKKRLTEFLGKCWHEFRGDFGPYNTACVKCQLVFGAVHTSDWDLTKFHRTFTTGNDMLDLKEKLVEKGKWEEFVEFANSKCLEDISTPGFYGWLFTMPRFAELVDEFLKEGNMNDEILVPLDLSDAIAMIDRQKQQIAALTAENKRWCEALEW